MNWQIIRDGYYNGTVLGVHFDPPVQQWIVIVESYFFDSLGEAQNSL